MIKNATVFFFEASPMTLPSFPLRLITAALVFSCQNIWALSPHELINGIKEEEGGKQIVANNTAQTPAPQMSKSTPESSKTSSWFGNPKSTTTEPSQVDEQALNNELAMIDRLANAGSLSNETAQKLRVAAIGKSKQGQKAVREKLANQILSQYCANEKTAKSILEAPEVPAAVQTPGSSEKSSSASTNALSNAPLAAADGIRPVATGVSRQSGSGSSSVPGAVAVEGTASSCEWVVSPDQGTIMNTLAIWANQAHWTLLWEHSRDFPVSANARFCGDFKSAIDQLIGAISQNDPIRVRLYSGNNVVRVTSAAN
ncbi:toxin co-regulated pilus biosynthesis Q family protein [Iodobacter sp. CM08]|uniref:toxin co-regulated pilus biosynthesis Q family protein n=1 Tax=Iodobacter sp. CM08 TaxID=3085902 RepID=UPI00298260C6|nr:toxin co-regulated pilus biosynthesis Q family protein [Iodobacter sp. CM08]MDW5418086.1 toxin co-regulated pilus biosynthesis Q family protein [Iodobacter sp. CM08]